MHVHEWRSQQRLAGLGQLGACPQADSQAVPFKGEAPGMQQRKVHDACARGGAILWREENPHPSFLGGPTLSLQDPRLPEATQLVSS